MYNLDIFLDFRNTSCFLPNVNFNNQCKSPLPVEVSIGQCCCGTSGNRYGSDCNACPKEGTGINNELQLIMFLKQI